MPAPLTIVEVLRRRAADTADRVAYRFLDDGTAGSVVSCSYAELWDAAQATAERVRPGSTVILARAPGIGFIAALFGIWMSGAVAVPAYPPVSSRFAERLRVIVADCRPDLIIAGDEQANAASSDAATHLADTAVHQYSTGIEPAWCGPEMALLQYTSGSVGEPKGVMLTHQNLLSNCEALFAHIGDESDRVGLSWLPPYHDMGLVGGILGAVYSGRPLVMMTPQHFIQNPYLWLRAISDYRATITLTPNFALRLCTEAISDSELDTLDLTSLRQIFCGSEPIMAQVVTDFVRRFGSCGLKPSSMIPCYGLAEATLFVAGVPAGTGMTADDGVTSCGVAGRGQTVLVVDPRGLRPAPEGDVGEIWVHGPNVAAGYYGRRELTEEVFQAKLLTEESGDCYLRTGDLGFLRNGELYVTGRMSDVMVVAGRNLYPQDIELTVNQSDSLLRRSAAFSIGGDSGEEFVIVAELHERGHDDQRLQRLRASIMAAVVASHGVRPVDVQFVHSEGVPTTTSGKIRRRAARDRYLQNVRRW